MPNHHKLSVCFNAGTATRQAGAVMAISLIMLLLLTLIGITGAQITGLEEKMAGNSKEEAAAFQAAESALRASEAAIAAAAVAPTGICDGVGVITNGFYDSTTNDADGDGSGDGLAPNCPTPPSLQAVWADPGKIVAYGQGGLRADYIVEQLDQTEGISDMLEAGRINGVRLNQHVLVPDHRAGHQH